MARADFYAVTAQVTVAVVLVLAVGAYGSRGAVRFKKRSEGWTFGFLAFFLCGMTMIGIGSCLYALYYGTDTIVTRSLALTPLTMLAAAGLAFAKDWAASFGESSKSHSGDVSRIVGEPQPPRLSVVALIVVLILARRRR